MGGGDTERVSALDAVADVVDCRRVKFDAELGENRDELWAEGFEGLRGLPDVEDLDFPVRFEGAVIEPAGRRAETGRVKFAEPSRRISSG